MYAISIIRRMIKIKALEEHLARTFGIHFNDSSLLAEAFTQASYVNEHPKENLKYYERIEFLGDAVMQLTVSEYIYQRYPEMPQGKLSRLRIAMVQEDSFSKFALECQFDQFIRLGKGEEKAGARSRSSLLCDIFESFIGALYLDQGKEAVVDFVTKVIFVKLDQGWFEQEVDYKTKLQEFLQQHGDVVIDYEVVSETGIESDRVYTVAVSADDQLIGEGNGTSKKRAEVQAAKNALSKLQ